MTNNEQAPPAWLLDLAMNVQIGHRPWLFMIPGGLTLVAIPWVTNTLDNMADPTGAPAEPPPAWVESVSGVLQSGLLVLAGIGGIAVIVGVGRSLLEWYAYRVWWTLPEEQRKTFVKERIERIKWITEALGDPAFKIKGLPIVQQDLEDLSLRHNAVIDQLRARGKYTP